MATACEDGPTRSPVPGFSIELTTPIPDSALAVVPRGLVVWLLGDDLAPISGAAVSFEAVASDSAAWLPSLYVTRDTAHLNWGQAAVDTTDADGRAWTALRLGCTAGTARVRVRLPSRSIDTTLSFSVVPGEAVRVQLFPSDTAVFTTHTVTLRGGVVDQCGNARSEPVAVSVDAHATLLGPGLKFGGGSVGLARVIATNDSGWADTATIAVVPPGVLAAWRSTTPGSGVVAMNLDGSGYRLVSSHNASYGVSWGPQGSVVIGNYDNFSYSRLTSISPQGTATLLLPLETVYQKLPGVSVDGAWIYYGRNFNPSEIWRVHPDGTGNARIGPINTTTADTGPSPSPDGTRVVFTRSSSIAVLNVVSGQVTSLGVACTTPAWSPDGTRLACMTNAGALLITQTDGNVLATFPGAGVPSGLAWTPDSQYVVVVHGNHLELVAIQSGATVPLPFTTSWILPSLRPYP